MWLKQPCPTLTCEKIGMLASSFLAGFIDGPFYQGERINPEIGHKKNQLFSSIKKDPISTLKHTYHISLDTEFSALLENSTKRTIKLE